MKRSSRNLLSSVISASDGFLAGPVEMGSGWATFPSFSNSISSILHLSCSCLFYCSNLGHFEQFRSFVSSGLDDVLTGISLLFVDSGILFFLSMEGLLISNLTSLPDADVTEEAEEMLVDVFSWLFKCSI